MTRENSLERIVASQVRWAAAAGVIPDSRWYVPTLDENLFLKKLHPTTESEFLAGDGAELLDRKSRPAKMGSLVSSSALAVNFFDAWRDAPGPLAQAFGLSAPIARLRFEQKCEDYPVPPRSPNLDLMLTLDTGRRVAVESKFAEPYRRPGADALLSPKYFKQAYWTEKGFSKSQELADQLRARWSYLDVAQMLKHLLGLANQSRGGGIDLMYLWYDTGLSDADTHRSEIERFAELVRPDGIDIVPRTYQAAFTYLRTSAEQPKEGWLRYVGERYFGAAK